MATALSLLSEYLSDESESENILPASKCTKLPLPPVLKLEKTSEVIDDPFLYNGRKRRYAHERGNWNSYIYIPYKHKETFGVFCDQIVDLLPNLELFQIEEPHISLSKTFILSYHWIKEFYSSLKQNISAVTSYEINFDGITVYCNENLSRTFVALSVQNNPTGLTSSIEIIDHCLQEYKLPTYYKDASFHLSFAWCLGDKKSIIEEKLLELQNSFEEFRNSSDFSFLVNQYILKTGFKEFKIDLR